MCSGVVFYKDLTWFRSAFFGSQRHPYDFHKNGWIFETLKEDLESVGFKNIRRYNWKNYPEHIEHDDYSQSYIPHLFKEGGVLISLNIEAEK